MGEQGGARWTGLLRRNLQSLRVTRTCQRIQGSRGCEAEEEGIRGTPRDPGHQWQRSRATWSAAKEAQRGGVTAVARQERLGTRAGRKADPGAGTET